MRKTFQRIGLSERPRWHYLVAGLSSLYALGCLVIFVAIVRWMLGMEMDIGTQVLVSAGLLLGTAAMAGMFTMALDFRRQPHG